MLKLLGGLSLLILTLSLSFIVTTTDAYKACKKIETKAFLDEKWVW
jgi:hypothetical protein